MAPVATFQTSGTVLVGFSIRIYKNAAFQNLQSVKICEICRWLSTQAPVVVKILGFSLA